MSDEEYQLREQRKQIIADINDYLNDQYQEVDIRPLTDEVFDKDDYEEEKVMEDDEEYEDIAYKPIDQKATKKKKNNILQPLMHSGVFIPPSITRQAINDALEDEEYEDDDQIKEIQQNAYTTDNQYVDPFQEELPL